MTDPTIGAGPAAGALTNLQSVIGKLSNLKIEEAAIQAEFTDGMAKLAKVHIVGSQATIAAMMAQRFVASSQT